MKDSTTQTTSILTISEGKNFLRNNAHAGTKCPCCAQHVKIYTRTITSSMAYALILLYKHPNSPEYIHMESYLKEVNCPASVRGDFPKLRFWGLIEPLEGNKEDGNPRPGYYRITEWGETFAQGMVSVEKTIMIYNNKYIPTRSPVHEVEFIYIQQALKNKFNYEKLMKGEL